MICVAPHDMGICTLMNNFFVEKSRVHITETKDLVKKRIFEEGMRRWREIEIDRERERDCVGCTVK